MPHKKWWSRLDDKERGILLKTAMMPSSVSLDTLIAVTGNSAVKILKLMERLVTAEVLSKDESLGEGFYRFSDPQLAPFVIEKTPQTEIRSAAKNIIPYLEDHLKEGLDKSLTLAHLYQISDLRPKRLDQILYVANHYLSQHMKDQAAIYYGMVLNNLPSTKRSNQQKRRYIAAVLGIVSAHGHVIPLKEQRSYLKSAGRIAKNIQDHENLVIIILVYARICEQEGSYKKAADLFEEGWSIAQELGKEDLLKKAALMTTDFLFRRGLVADAVKRYEQVIGNLEEFSSDEATLRACAVLGWCYGICGQTARGIGLIESVRFKAEEVGLEEMKIFADIMTVLTLLEARRIPEAEVYLTQILSLPEDVLGYYVLWAAYCAKAYVTYTKGDLHGCFNFQKKAYEFAKKYGWPHHRGPWNFEYIEKLEEVDLIHPEMNYDSEIKRILKWPDIFMKGVAHRFKAQRALKHSRPTKEIHQDLKKSLKLLSKAGARLELARAQILFSQVLLKKGKVGRARPLLEEAWQVMSAVNRNNFPDNLRKYIEQEDKEELLFKTVVEVGNVLGTVREEKILLERFIDLILQFTSAEKGGVFLADQSDRLELAASRNLDPAMVRTGKFQPILGDIKRVARSGRQIVKGYGTEMEEALDRFEESRSGWMICSPLILQDRILGVLYLAGKLTQRISQKEDLIVLRAIGNQVAIALDNVRAYEEIALLRDRLEEETRFYRMDSEFSPQLAYIVGRSEAIFRVQGQMQKVAPTDSTVLINGETGVGKELVARGIHRLSTRAKGPFIAVNTASFAEGVIVSELFGHEKGAFTGAVKTRLGRFELADKGTLFLDDIQNLSQDIQVKLLRTLEEKEFERVGGSKSIKSDFRLIAATNLPLEDMVAEGQFRSDLFYRLNVFPIHVPPLRERQDDTPLLAMHFLEKYRKRFGKEIQGISSHNMKRLVEYQWPGNVRELQHVIERAVILSEGKFLALPNLKAVAQDERRRSKYKSLEEMERSYIIEVLEACGWKVRGAKGAAKLLNVKPTTLYSKMKRLGVQRKVTYVEG